jgi:ABC-type dipeptide/oligopeptide/nickel transport system permease subunit
MMQNSDSVLPQSELLSADAIQLSKPPKGLWRETLERLIRQPSAIVGLIILGILALIAIFAPVLATHDPLAVLLDVPEEGVDKRAKPCIHLFGCASAGDILVQVSAAAPINAAVLNSTDSLAAATTGNLIKVWNTENGKEIMSFEHEQPVTALDWSPNDQRIVSASGEEIYIWETNRRVLGRTLAHPGGATLVAWNADGTRFLSADARHVRLWDTLSWREIGVIELEDELVAAQWNSNGTVAMTASGNQVTFWNAFTATEVATLEHDAPLTGAQFNGASSRVLTTSGSRLYIWSASTYEQISIVEYDGDLANATWSEAVARGIRRVMASHDDTALVWEEATGELLLELDHGEPIEQIAGSPLATRIFTRGATTIRVWDTKNGQQVLEMDRDTPMAATFWQSTGGGVLVASGNNLSVVKTSDYQYIMGTDGNLRDQFSRVLYGTRLSLLVGLSTVTLAVLVGTAAGSIAGYAGGWVDNVIMRFMDVMLAFPPLILAIAVVSVLGPGIINALLAISIVFIPAYARVARSGVLAVKEEDFVTADRVLGVSPARILFRRILPNALAPLIVQATLGIGTAILDAAALSFLGLGAQPPTPEWGAMLGAERSQILTAPHLVFYPGIAIMITVLAFNLLGDGLRDALDPRLDR